MMRCGFLLLATLALASCGPPKIVCDADGKIIIPAGLDGKTAANWNQRNLDLAVARLDRATGYFDGRSTPADKAVGCP